MNLQVMLDALPELLKGSVTTIELVGLSGLCGVLIAMPLAVARASNRFWVRALPTAYIFFFRGTPLLVQIFLVYYGLGQFEAVRESFLWPVLREAYWCAIITFSLHTAAYISEILRGAIRAIPVGEIEAAKALGMTRFTVLRRIVMPRAWRIALPAYGNELVLMIKGSALASTITLLDLTGMARTVIAKNYMPVETFLTAGILYLVLAYGVTRAIAFAERKLNPDRYVDRDAEATSETA